jgi:hypothetical protein
MALGSRVSISRRGFAYVANKLNYLRLGRDELPVPCIQAATTMIDWDRIGNDLWTSQSWSTLATQS